MHEKIVNFEMELIRFCSKQGLNSRRWAGLKRAQVWEVGHPMNILIYARESSGDTGVWWGITFNVLKKLCDSGKDWRLVLLVGSREEAYILKGSTVSDLVSGLSRSDVQYIVHAPELPAGSHCNTFDEVCKRALI
jgi:hypothetical protein